MARVWWRWFTNPYVSIWAPAGFGRFFFCVPSNAPTKQHGGYLSEHVFLGECSRAARQRCTSTNQPTQIRNRVVRAYWLSVRSRQHVLPHGLRGPTVCPRPEHSSAAAPALLGRVGSPRACPGLYLHVSRQLASLGPRTVSPQNSVDPHDNMCSKKPCKLAPHTRAKPPPSHCTNVCSHQCSTSQPWSFLFFSCSSSGSIQHHCRLLISLALPLNCAGLFIFRL